ncbi:unnamed protein product, partial [Allacma fusca]
SAIYTAVALFCTTLVQGEKCRFRFPLPESNLRCKNSTYPVETAYLHAVNFCGIHRNGTEITDQDIRCILERAGYVTNGRISSSTNEYIMNTFSDTELLDGVYRCVLESFKNTDQKNQFEHVNCRF